MCDLDIDIDTTPLNKYELVTLCYLFLNLFYISRKIQKQVKYTAFSLKVGLTFHPQSTFLPSPPPAKQPQKTLYVYVSKMFKFNLKMCI